MEHTDYALDTASKLLEFYNDFFEINYPLKKLGEYTQAHGLKLSSDCPFFLYTP